MVIIDPKGDEMPAPVAIANHSGEIWPAMTRFAAVHSSVDIPVIGAHFIILELFSAVMNLNVRPLAAVFVISALVWVLEASPSTNVVDQNGLKISGPALNFLQQLKER
jgi:hypothetical protein